MHVSEARKRGKMTNKKRVRERKWNNKFRRYVRWGLINDIICIDDYVERGIGNESDKTDETGDN